MLILWTFSRPIPSESFAMLSAFSVLDKLTSSFVFVSADASLAGASETISLLTFGPLCSSMNFRLAATS